MMELYQALMGYKEVGTTGVEFTVKKYYSTQWMPFDDLPLEIKGLSLDEVYDNFLNQLNTAIIKKPDEELRTWVDKSAQLEKIMRDISKIEARILKETQFNKQVALNAKLRELKLKAETFKTV